MHECDVLIRRSEKLFKAVERETESLKMKKITQKVRNCKKQFQTALERIEAITRRMNNDVHPMVSRLPAPEKAREQAQKNHAQSMKQAA
jgi:hypothetical protein